MNLRLIAIRAVEAADARPEFDDAHVIHLMLRLREKRSGHGRLVFVGQSREIPIRVLFRVLGELHDEFLVRRIAGNRHPVLEEFNRIDVGHAAFLQDLGIQCGEFVTHRGK